MKMNQTNLGHVLLSALAILISLTGLALLGQGEETDIGFGEVDTYFGTFNTEVPIAVPEFRGLEPRLKLVYSSGGPNSWVGSGWALQGASFIERGRPNGGAPAYDSSDSFFLDGMELVPSTLQGGTHCTEILNYDRIERDEAGDRWTIRSSNGNSAIYEPIFVTANGTFRWMLTSVADQRGNQVTYAYVIDGSNNIYPDKITYNGAEIRFYLESRPDVLTFATGASIGRTLKRLQSIDISVNGQRVRAYQLGYETSPESNQSRLVSVQQYGRDAALDGTGRVISGTVLPAFQLQHAPEASDFQAETIWGSFETAAGQGVPNAAFVDFNGDGRDDFIYKRKDTKELRVKLSDGSSFATESIWGSFDKKVAPKWPNASFVDLDGDGKTDFIYRRNSTRELRVMLSTGNAFGPESIWTTFEKAHGSAVPAAFVDLDADGKTDFVYQRASTRELRVLLSTGSGFGTETIWGSYEKSTGSIVRPSFIDLNGDGRADFVYQRSGVKELRVMLSTGTGFAPETVWANYAKKAGTAVPGPLFRDVNGDSKADFIYRRKGSRELRVMLSTGNGFATETIWGSYEKSAGQFRPNAQFTDVNGDRLLDFLYRPAQTRELRVKYGTGETLADEVIWSTYAYDVGQAIPSAYFPDLNGDGRPDFVYKRQNTRDLHVQTSNAAHHGLLEIINNGVGGTTNLEYTPSSNWTNTYLPRGLVIQTVTSITSEDGRGSSSTTDYLYEGGLWSDQEKRFLGFHKVTAILDAQGNYTETFYKQEVGSIGKPETTYFRDNQGNIFNFSQITYLGNTVAPFTSLMEERWDFQCNQSTNCRASLTQFAYDAFGNVIQVYEHGDYNLAGDERTTVRGYVPNEANYLVGLPAFENLYDGIGTNGTLVRQVLFSYDDNSSYDQAPTVGNITGIKKWNSLTGGFVSTNLSYDSWGNIIGETDERGFQSSLVFDPVYNIFPIQASNALGHITTRTWDTVLGLETAITDPNGAAIITAYDALGRRQTITHPDGSVTSFQYNNLGDPNQQRIREIKPDASADGLWRDTYQDGLGRIYRVVAEGGLTRDTVYVGATRRILRESLPYQLGETPRWQSKTYDGTGRLRTLTHPDGAFSEIVYANDADGKPFEANYDELGNERVFWKDSYDQITEIRENLNGTYHFTSYQYDAGGRIITSTDANLNQTLVSWDSLDRKLASSDPDMGTWSYRYDDGGNLVSRTDALGQTLTSSYDALGRITNKQYPDGTQTNWNYDAPGQGASIGRLTSVVYANGSETYNWDIRGLEIGGTRCVAGSCRTIQRSHDSLGRPATITYPDGEIVTHSYDDTGRLRSLSGYVNDLSWSPAGQLLAITYSNGVTTELDYDDDRLAMIGARVGLGSQTLYDASYSFDDAMRVTAVASTTNPLLNLNFSYDTLNRLIAVGGAQTQSFSYDALGNMTFNSWVGDYAYDAPDHAHAVTAAGGTNYAYDANGNMTSRGGDLLNWDAENRLASIQAGGNNTSFAYDAGGNRILEQRAGSLTRYFSTLVEEIDGVDTQYYFAGPMMVAKKTVTGTFFYHADHLNSVRLITDETGQVENTRDYAAFGEVLEQTGQLTDAMGFNGHREDAASGLVYMKARYYDPVLARFISADTVVPDPLNPQAFNRYAFAYNNPISNLDPTGHAPVADAVLTAVTITVLSGGNPIIALTAFVGAGLRVAGYFADNPVLELIGNIMQGAASAATGDPSQLTKTILGDGSGGGSALGFLDPDAAEAVGWVFSPEGLLGVALSESGDVFQRIIIVHQNLGIAAERIKSGKIGLDLAFSLVDELPNGKKNGVVAIQNVIDAVGGRDIDTDPATLVSGFQGLASATSLQFLNGNGSLSSIVGSLPSLSVGNLGGSNPAGRSAMNLMLPDSQSRGPGTQVSVGNPDARNGFFLFGSFFNSNSPLADREGNNPL